MLFQSLTYFHFSKLSVIQFALSNLVGSIILTLLLIFKGISQPYNITSKLFRKALASATVEFALTEIAGGGLYHLCPTLPLGNELCVVGGTCFFKPRA